MQLQFHKTPVACLRRLKGELQTQEQTQELRLPEEMPDMGSVLGAWGQVLIRGKEWHAGGMDLSCGVMAWAMYQPEEGSAPQMVEAWIPFTLQWDLPATDRDGRMNVSCLLRSVEARPVSARRLMLRATVGAMAEAWVPDEKAYASAEDLPEDIRVLKKTYPLRLPKEAGEKTFQMEEELTLPSSIPAMEKLLRFSLQPELVEKKVLAGKIIFRGVARLHILYQDVGGNLQTWEMELPFSQYADLEDLYDQDADAWVGLAVTALELDKDAEGCLRLNAGLTGQYVVSDVCCLELVEDAYSPNRPVTVLKEDLELPVLLECSNMLLPVEQSSEMETSRVVDVAFYPEQPRQSRSMDAVDAEFAGSFQVLAYNREGELCGNTAKWHDVCGISLPQDATLQTWVTPAGSPQGIQGTDLTLSAEIAVQRQSFTTKGLPMVTGLEVGEVTEPDENRPSLILRRMGEEPLWEVAKATGSTVEDILSANQLSEEPEPGTMLLIPIA